MCRVHKRAKSIQVNTMVYHSFGSMGPILFNAVPTLVKSSISPESFKAPLDDFLMTLPDTPRSPTPGYVAANNNSLLEWTASTNGRALPLHKRTPRVPFHMYREKELTLVSRARV